ncbi:MAG: isochorismatase family protein [Luminiphilus sp.]|nr:isochorismatase family protein [Luminiphilus sp.]MBL6820310.1 isochorismatase family protein [Luminiphilus sp.]
MSQRNALERIDGGMGQRPALIVVDVVVGFTDPACPLGSEADAVVQANVDLMNAFHQAQMPVVLTTVVYHNEEQASVFRARVPALNLLTPDSQWVQFDPRLPIVETDLQLEKRHASSFHGTDLNNWLRANHVDTVVVTGLTTSGCVRATAVDGLQNNYRVLVPREACGDRDAQAHEANLYDLNAKYADVVSLREVLDSLPG